MANTFWCILPINKLIFDQGSNRGRRSAKRDVEIRALGLNLVVSAIVHWNTVYLHRAITQLKRAGRDMPDTLSKHISPLSWERIDLTGIYTWDAEHQMPNGFRSLRMPAGLRRVA
ncbi:Tn3 family transposase [Neorhizobium galegae]|uniref:Tn3 family transposase n=1 Tax=Neorhizobium galegae TaxID=399 RepID=UPI00062779D2|nr:Tn3 family transposase [Neorhizobium galegae]MCM2498720.1 Tn3 family transposase [Neorhizobium galegae]MCQ1781204.1 Tn3 family transposase [Neorhizobium galegae]MCQ1798538.1 Tn3 family transposase [Neorhizobium galegae]